MIAQQILAPAHDCDLAGAAALVNMAYRGEMARRGWTSEADILDGIRTDEATLRSDLAAIPGARLLLLRDRPDAVPVGCVWLEPHPGGVWHLGMLTVRPDEQGNRIGRRLLGGAETYAREHGASRMRMTVISIRDTLIAWYERRGYRATGELLPFPYDPPRPDLHFAVLEKHLA